MEDQQSVWVAVYEHVYGTDVCVFKTEAQAAQWRTEVATNWWGHEFPDDEQPPEDKIGEVYFDMMSERGYDQENFMIQQAEVKGD